MLTSHAWTGRFIITIKITAVSPSLSMGVKSVLPFSYLSDSLFAVLVFLVVVWPGWIIYVVPILCNSIFLTVLLASLASTSLSFLSTSIKSIHVIVVSCNSPIG